MPEPVSKVEPKKAAPATPASPSHPPPSQGPAQSRSHAGSSAPSPSSQVPQDQTHTQEAAHEAYGHLDALSRNFKVFDGAAAGGSTDGHLSQKDVQALDHSKDQTIAQEVQHQDQGLSPEQVQSRVAEIKSTARYLSQPGHLASLDTAAQGGQPDGAVSQKDVDAALTRTRGQLAPQEQHQLAQQQVDALTTLNHDFRRFDTGEHGGAPDGNIATADIQAVAQGQRGASAPDRLAAQYFLDHPDRLQALDNAAASDKSGLGDGRIAQKDVDQSLIQAHQSLRTAGRTPQQIAAYDGQQARAQVTAVGDLQNQFSSFSQDGRITQQSLQQVAGNSQGTAGQQQTARYFLDHPERLPGLGQGTPQDLKNAGIDAFNELRTHPDAQRQQEVQAQQDRRWGSLGQIEQNLRQNPDLSTYSPAQLLSANALAERNPALRDQLQETTARYVTDHTRTVDQLPGDPAFQQVLHDQVVSPQGVDPAHQSEATRAALSQAQTQLQGALRQKLEDSALQQLDGKKGGDGAKQGVQDFIHQDIPKLAKDNPALVPYFEKQAQAALADSKFQSKLQDVQNADQNFLSQALNWTGNTLGNLAGDGLKLVMDHLTPLGLGPLKDGLNAVGLSGVSHFLNNTEEGLAQGVNQTISGTFQFGAQIAQDPVGVGKHLGDLALNFGPLAPLYDSLRVATGTSPEAILNRDKQLGGNLLNAFTSGYKQTAQQYGAEGVVGQVVADVGLTVASGGVTDALKGSALGAKIADAFSLGAGAADASSGGAAAADSAKVASESAGEAAVQAAEQGGGKAVEQAAARAARASGNPEAVAAQGEKAALETAALQTLEQAGEEALTGQLKELTVQQLESQISNVRQAAVSSTNNNNQNS